MADNYTALKSSQKKRYISKETFNSLDLSQIPVGSEYEVVSPIEKGDLSADINNALNKAEKSISEPTNQTTGSDGDVLVKKGGGSEWKSMPVPGVVQGIGQSTTDVMSQKATTDSLNLLEAKLNENIVKDPSKTYLVWKGLIFLDSIDATFKAPANSTIDWGDGTIETFETASETVNTHTYADGIGYHLITISGLTQIGDHAFESCERFKNIIIANSITTIGVSAFRDCHGLTSITIPDSVTSIGNYAFGNCSRLESIVIKSTTPPMLSPDAIPTTIKKIIVPKQSILAYKGGIGWSLYADKIVYEVDSSDLPDMSNYVDLNSTQQIIGKKQFAQAEFLDTPNSYSGYKVGNPFVSSTTTTYENGYIDFKNKDNSHKGSIKIPSVNDDFNTFALVKDIPDTSNLSSFSVEVW